MSPLRLTGSTSGYSQLDAPAVAGDQTFTLPGTGGTLDRLNRAGNVLQVVQTVKTDTFSTTSTSFTAVTGLSASITPSSASSKILIYTSFVGATTSGTPTSAGVGRFMRDSTAIGTGTAVGSRQAASFGVSTRLAGISLILHTVGHFLDSPNTTSTVSYSVQVLVGAGTLFIGRSEEDNDGSNAGRFPSVITLLEVAA